MFLGLPHQASRYYGTLMKSIETKIFVPGHHLSRTIQVRLLCIVWNHYCEKKPLAPSNDRSSTIC